jgi:hypothetical protein
VPAATLYLHIAPIVGVGERTLEIQDLGDLGIANEDVRMCGGGALVIVSFAHFTLDQVTQGLETD